ncbi:MAG TPA: response regulator, partial [Thermoanaerobaculia bacterium]
MTSQDPRRKDHPQRRRSDQTGEAEAIRVLAVDDDPFYLRYIARLLGRLGFQVRGVTCAEDALSTMESEEYDLLLMDLKMPGMNGIEAIQQLRTVGNSNHIYSILLTANEAFSTRIRALECGFDDFILKTSSEIEVLAKLRSATRLVIAQRSLQTENRELYRMAFTDPLTGIPNRRYFFDHAEELLAGRTRLLTVVLYDLDDFKRINDVHGHITGDR